MLEIQDAKITQNRNLRAITPRYRAISSQLKHLSTIGKKLLSSNITSRCPHNIVKFGPLTAEIGSGVWGTPANFNGFRVLALLLQRCYSLEANQTLHDVCPSMGWYTIYTFSGALAPWRNLARCKIHFLSQVLRSPILATLLHGTRAVGVSQNLRRATRNGIAELSQRAPPIFNRAAITYWASAHILVAFERNSQRKFFSIRYGVGL